MTWVPGTVLALPVRPHRYGRGDDLPLGTFTIVPVVGGRYTVLRRIGLQAWYPLTARDNPEWRTWPSFENCAREVMEGDLFNFADWPHWGTGGQRPAAAGGPEV